MAEEVAGECNVVKKVVDWHHTALLVIDMQNDFIGPGVLHVRGGSKIVPAVTKAVSITRDKGGVVIWVVRQHCSSGRDVELFRSHLYTSGIVGPTVRGTRGAELVEGLEPKPEDHVIVKYRFSAFFNTNLDLLLRRMGISNVVIVDTKLHSCHSL